MEVELNWRGAVKVVESQGMHDFLMLLMKAYPQLGIYAVSMDWMKSPKFVCKAKGSGGDLLIQWRSDDEWSVDDAILSREGIG